MERWTIREPVSGLYHSHLNTSGPYPGGWAKFDYRLRFDLAVEGVEVVRAAPPDLALPEHLDSLRKGAESGWTRLRERGQRVTSLIVEVGRIDRHPFDYRLVGSTHGAMLLLDAVHRHGVRTRPLEPGWRTPTVVALAAGVATDLAFDRLPILADALEEAGCDDPEVLDHCHGPGPHAGGCWVIDLLVGKQ